MNRIVLGLAGALAAAGSLVGTPHIAGAQGYHAYGAPPAYHYPGPYRGYVYNRAPRWDDRGDPLHRYYVPGLAANVRNPSVSPSYMAPHVDDGLIYGGGRAR